jgi:DNA-binding MarR family transcriptional regulator
LIMKKKRKNNKNNKKVKPIIENNNNSVSGQQQLLDSFLFRRGNVGLARLLLVVHAAGPEGISTVKLLEQLGSTHHAQAFIKRAKREKLIERKQGESEHGHFSPVYNIITEKGKKLLSQLQQKQQGEEG